MFLLYFVSVAIFNILWSLFFKKTISVTETDIVQVHFTKSREYGNTINISFFVIFLVHIFSVTNSYSGWTLLVSIPFTIATLYPLYNTIVNWSKRHILIIHTLMKTITVDSEEYNVFEIKAIEVVYRIDDNSDYSISKKKKKNEKIHIVVLDEVGEVRMLVKKLEYLLQMKAKYYHDGGLLGIKEKKRSDF